MNLFGGSKFIWFHLLFADRATGDTVAYAAKGAIQTAWETTNFDVCAVPAAEEFADSCVQSCL